MIPVTDLVNLSPATVYRSKFYSKYAFRYKRSSDKFRSASEPYDGAFWRCLSGFWIHLFKLCNKWRKKVFVRSFPTCRNTLVESGDKCLITDIHHTKEHFIIQNVSVLYSNKEIIPANTYLVKVNNRNIEKRCETCSKLTIKHKNEVSDVVWRRSVLLLKLNIFHTFF